MKWFVALLIWDSVLNDVGMQVTGMKSMGYEYTGSLNAIASIIRDEGESASYVFFALDDWTDRWPIFFPIQRICRTVQR